MSYRDDFANLCDSYVVVHYLETHTTLVASSRGIHSPAAHYGQKIMSNPPVYLAHQINVFLKGKLKRFLLFFFCQSFLAYLSSTNSPPVHLWALENLNLWILNCTPTVFRAVQWGIQVGCVIFGWYGICPPGINDRMMDDWIFWY